MMAYNKSLILLLLSGILLGANLLLTVVADELDLADDLSISELDESEEEFLRLLEEKNLVSRN